MCCPADRRAGRAHAIGGARSCKALQTREFVSSANACDPPGIRPSAYCPGTRPAHGDRHRLWGAPNLRPIKDIAAVRSAPRLMSEAPGCLVLSAAAAGALTRLSRVCPPAACNWTLDPADQPSVRADPERFLETMAEATACRHRRFRTSSTAAPDWLLGRLDTGEVATCEHPENAFRRQVEVVLERTGHRLDGPGLANARDAARTASSRRR